MDLAVKYRPDNFKDVTGQEFITNILSKQISTKTHKNAYLFCGAHGCGKTTCARIFANEINHHEGSPIEIDGASNNGVDDIRNMIEDAQQSSVDSEYKVYIIDEAHMITIQGWNAALKLIEEPPTHCIFIFCTTNPEKIPLTILSRVQRFDFNKISADKIASRLEYILQSEGCENYDKVALEKLAILSEGHMRDAIKILDSCLDVSGDITLDLVESTFGLVKQESINKFIESLINKNFKDCIDEYNHCLTKSFDGVKLYDAILSSILSVMTEIYIGNITDRFLKNLLKTENTAKYINIIKNIINIFYENRKNITVENSDIIIKYCFIKCCE